MEKIDTKTKITNFIENREQVSITQLVDFLGFSRQIIHRHIAHLIEDGSVKKQGSPPHVFYSLNKNKKYSIDADTGNYNTNFSNSHTNKFSKEQIDCLNENFFIIDPQGERQEGVLGFVIWCEKRNFDVSKKIEEYVKTVSKFEKYKKQGLISGMHKMKDTFKEVYLDEVFYLDFYSIEIFGKTKLGQLMLYAKQSQNKKLIKELADQVKERIENLIKDKKIDAIGFVPPTVKREVQFIKEIEKNLNLALPKISLSKIKGEFIVPQKTLNKLEDRIENAKQIRLHVMGNVIDNKIPVYNNILLIDDAMGSGATMNEIARQIKNMNVSSKVTGLAITGSFSGFEVISEV